MLSSFKQFTRVPVYQLRTAHMVQIANLSDDSKDSNRLWWDQYRPDKLDKVTKTMSNTVSKTVSKTVSNKVAGTVADAVAGTNNQLMEKGLSQSLQLLEQLQKRLDKEQVDTGASVEGSIGFTLGMFQVNLTLKRDVR